MAEKPHDKNYDWRPVSLDYLLSTYNLMTARVAIPVISWIFLIAFSLLATSQMIASDWIELSAGSTQIINFFIFNPALILGMLLLFWFGFEWGFIPVYLCTFIVALHSDMTSEWALAIGLSFVLGMGIYALAYQSFPISYTLRSFQSIAFFVIISFVAAIASSLGSFIWSFFHQLSAADTLVIWKSWWSGIFLQLILVNGPLLFFFGPAVERIKARYLVIPERKIVSKKWVYGSVISVTVTLALFVYAGNLLGKLRIQEVANLGDMAALSDVMEAIGTFELISWTSIGLIVITGYAAIYLLGSWNSELEHEINRRTRELEESEKELKESLEEKKILLQEVHHRVKNNLAQVHALLVLQENTGSQLDTAESLRISRARIKSMALAHEALYQTESVSSIDLREYIKKIIEAIHQSFKRDDLTIELRHSLISTHIGMEKAIPLGLLINEIMINSYKHAFNGKESGYIDVSMHSMPKELAITISDNGTGMKESVTLGKSKSLGMLLIQKFTHQLSAECDINSSDNGTSYEIQIPLDD